MYLLNRFQTEKYRLYSVPKPFSFMKTSQMIINKLGRFEYLSTRSLQCCPSTAKAIVIYVFRNTNTCPNVTLFYLKLVFLNWLRFGPFWSVECSIRYSKHKRDWALANLKMEALERGIVWFSFNLSVSSRDICISNSFSEATLSLPFPKCRIRFIFSVFFNKESALNSFC